MSMVLNWPSSLRAHFAILFLVVAIPRMVSLKGYDECYHNYVCLHYSIPQAAWHIIYICIWGIHQVHQPSKTSLTIIFWNYTCSNIYHIVWCEVTQNCQRYFKLFSSFIDFIVKYLEISSVPSHSHHNIYYHLRGIKIFIGCIERIYTKCFLNVIGDTSSL